MGLSEATIYFNFEQAKRQANELDALANRLSKMATSDLDGAMQTVSANWKGSNASAYLSKGNKLENEMVSTANSLHKVASDIRTIAQNIYNAEMRALAIAQERTYK